jgi:hypothetical protein
LIYPSKLVISISAEISDLQNNRLFDLAVANRYPGSQWAHELRKVVDPSIAIITADIALNLIERRECDPRNVYVIQHGEDPISVALIARGAKPFLLTMFESPLYAGRFYDEIESISKKFAYVMAYGANYLPNFIPIRFPSFSKNELVNIRDE